MDIAAGPVEPVRRLALGHWLRRWWPASERDGIAQLDPALLDAEVALLTAGAQDYFTDDTLDSDVAQLLAPHGAVLNSYAREADPRIADLARGCAELAWEMGVPGWSAALVASPGAVGHRADYALAAGPGSVRPAAVTVASGVGSLRWAAVPPAVFDAAEDTVQWAVEIAGAAAVAIIQMAVSGPGLAAGIEVRLNAAGITGSGVLDAAGRATLTLVDQRGLPLAESAAWNHDWAATAVSVGPDVDESRETRDRIRAFARRRLQRPEADAFLAEIVAAESDY